MLKTAVVSSAWTLDVNGTGKVIRQSPTGQHSTQRSRALRQLDPCLGRISPGFSRSKRRTTGNTSFSSLSLSSGFPRFSIGSDECRGKEEHEGEAHDGRTCYGEGHLCDPARLPRRFHSLDDHSLRHSHLSGILTCYRQSLRAGSADPHSTGYGEHRRQWRSEIRDLLFEPSPEVPPKLRIVTARLAHPCPWAEILACTA